MNNFSAFWNSPALSSISELVRTDAFTRAMDRQEWLNKAISPALDFWEQQERLNRSLLSATEALGRPYELMPQNITHDMVKAITAYPTLSEALERPYHAAAMLRQPFIGISASLAAQEKAFAQMARISRITALQETWESIGNLIPAVQESIANADLTLPAFEYLEENQPELCQQVDKTLAAQVSPGTPQDNINAYMIFCTEIIAGLEGIKEVTTDPNIKAGCVSLIIIFASLMAYLKYCKEEQ